MSCLHQLTIDNDTVFRWAEHACKQAVAALSAWQLDVTVRAVAAGVQRSVVQRRCVLVHVDAAAIDVVTVCALGTRGLGKQRVVRVVVQ